MQANCKEGFCKERALSLSAYCWKHIEDKKAFIAQLEEHNKRGHSMEGFYLKGLKTCLQQLYSGFGKRRSIKWQFISKTK